MTACSQLQFSAGHDSRASFWKFKKLEKVDGDPQQPQTCMPICFHYCDIESDKSSSSLIR